jgi:hypothetical protein
MLYLIAQTGMGDRISKAAQFQIDGSDVWVYLCVIKKAKPYSVSTQNCVVIFTGKKIRKSSKGARGLSCS